MERFSFISCILVILLISPLDANVSCVSKSDPSIFHCKLVSKDAVLWKLPSELKNAFTIFLNNTAIRNIHHEEFDLLLNLENLHLHSNKLTILSPSWFSNLVNLKRIDLSRNFISFVSSNTFESCEKLEHIDLSRNKITRFCDTSENLYNAVLDLSFNPLSLLDIGNVGTLYLNSTDLEELHLKHSVANLFVPDSRLKIFSFEFSNLSRLETLDFSGNNLTNIKNISVLQIGPTYLDLSRNNIGTLSPDTFIGLSRLRHLNLSQTVMLNLYYGLFWSQTNLKVLDVSGNYLWNFNTNKLYPAVLDELYIQNNTIYKIIDERNMFGSLKKFAIYGNSLSCEDLFDLYLNAKRNSVELFIPPSSLNFANDNIAGMSCNPN